MSTKHKYRVGDMVWEATQFGVLPAEITARFTTRAGKRAYTVIEHRDRDHNHTEVEEQYLFSSKKDALNYALLLNDDSQFAVHDGIRSAVSHLEGLQQANIRMRQLLYEEQIQEYMKGKQQ